MTTPFCQPMTMMTYIALTRRRTLHLLWIVPSIWLLCSGLFSWGTSDGADELPRKQQGRSSLVIGLRTEEGLNNNSHKGDVPFLELEDPSSSRAEASPASASAIPPSILFPSKLKPILRPTPQGESYLTGPELMDLRRAYISSNGGNETDSAVEDRPVYGGYSAGAESCAGVDMSVLANGMACGAPLSWPCFDRGRCRPSPEGPGPSIYVYDEACSLANSSSLPPSNESLMLSHTWREAARDAGVLSEAYLDACVFVHVNKKIDEDPCATESPLWHGGLNHIMVDLTDRTRDMKRAVADSVAMDASSNTRSCYYRSGYDFALPLRHKLSLANITYLPPWERDYFVTVKGNLYLSGTGYEERLNLVPLHSEPDGVIVALNCFELHDEHLLPENVDFCDALNVTASRHDYEDLMNTTFGLVPAGRSPATYRLAEVMSAGAIPVFVAREYVRPFPERVDWPSFSFMFPPEEIGASMMATLRNVGPKELWEMQQKSVEAFLDIFGEEPGYDRIARVVVDELVKRVGFHR